VWSYSRLAGKAACTWCLLWCVARNAHWLEALHALAAGRSGSSKWGSIRAGTLHGSVAIKRYCLFAGKAGWAALAFGARQRKRRKALDVGTSCHQATGRTLIMAMVDSCSTTGLTHELCLICGGDQLGCVDLGCVDLGCNQSWLARIAASTWHLPWLIACNAHWREALNTLAAGRGSPSKWSSVWAGSLHGSVAIECNCFLICKASWAALTFQTLQHKWWNTLDVSAACHQATGRTLVMAMVDG